ncbi:MAG: peptidoglycan editing factor PgeF [Erysipelotrichaceae bacterium]|nr:peptidoglycan editing factor PgeF [Erysipelotrichaceae bacterium]
MKLIPWEIDGIEAYNVCSINMSYHGYDNTEVLKNRQALATYLHSDLKHMVAPSQQHTTNFQEVTIKDGGRGMLSKADAFENCDALYTRDSNLWLWTFHADCCPVLLYCEDQRIVAAIHSGWKGTVNEIVGKVTKHLIDHENCHPQSIYAYIGPSLEQRNFEARDDIIDLVNQMSFDTHEFYIDHHNGTYHLNSKGLIKQQLLNLGILDNHITVSPYCTLEEKDLFYSYRRDKSQNRNISIIRLKADQ